MDFKLQKCVMATAFIDTDNNNFESNTIEQSFVWYTQKVNVHRTMCFL